MTEKKTIHWKRRKAMAEYWKRYWRKQENRWAGSVFGRLTVTGILPRQSSGNRRVSMAKCLCACGRSVEVRLNNLRTGNTRSCGCAHGVRYGKTGAERKKTVVAYCREAGISRSTFYNWAKASSKAPHGNSK